MRTAFAFFLDPIEKPKYIQSICRDIYNIRGKFEYWLANFIQETVKFPPAARTVNENWSKWKDSPEWEVIYNSKELFTDDSQTEARNKLWEHAANAHQANGASKDSPSNSGNSTAATTNASAPASSSSSSNSSSSSSNSTSAAPVATAGVAASASVQANNTSHALGPGSPITTRSATQAPLGSVPPTGKAAATTPAPTPRPNI